MPPKTQKSAARRGSAAAGRGWEAALCGAPLDQVSWQACVSLVVGSSPTEEQLLQALALQRPPYRLFTSVTWDGTAAKIHELGNPKAKKPDNAPPFYEVTEPAKVLLDGGQEIPCDLMAKILKFQLLQIKASDQQRREADKVGPPSASKDRGGTKVPDRKGTKPSSPVELSKEKKTKLKRRDDVESPQFKGGEPDDGPQHYILLLGFYQPHLIGALDAVGVHVANVIKVCSEPLHTSEVQEEPLDADPVRAEQAAQARKLDGFWSGLRPVLDHAPRDSKLHNVAQLSYTIPDPLPAFCTQDPEAVLQLGSRILEGVASLIFDCLDWRRQHQHYLDHLRLISLPAVVGLDSQPAEALPASLPAAPMTPHSKKKPVLEESPPHRESVLHHLSTDVDMRYYNHLLDQVPPEACSVPLILHCVLEQVVMSSQQAVSEEPNPPDGLWLDEQLVGFMLQSFLPLVHTEEERRCMLNGLLTTVHREEDKKRLVQTFGEKEPQKKLKYPLVIRHHDERALRFKDMGAVEGFDPTEVESSLMSLVPVWELIQSVAHQKHSDSCWMALSQQLQHYCADDVVSWPEVERLFHQSVFESMPLTRLDQQDVLLKPTGPLGAVEPAHQHTPLVIPWDNPPAYAKQQLYKLQTEGAAFLTEDPGDAQSGRVCGRLDLLDIQSCRRRSLFDWHYSEHHDASVFPQVLQLASEEYCCLDTFRGSHNNVMYIFCHNPMSPHRRCKEFWDVALHSDVKFRKYLEHVAGTITDWTREEELKREEMQPRDLSLAGSPRDEKAPDVAEEEGTLEPVIRKGSLKAWKLEQERLIGEGTAKKSKKEGAPKVKQLPEEEKSTDSKKSKASTAGKKSRTETEGGSPRTPTGSVTPTAPPVEESGEVHQTGTSFNGFTGYSMDGKLIHLSGRLQHLFPSDGGHISVENVSYVEGSSIMKLAVDKDGHHFYTHINHIVAVDPVKHPPQLQNKETDDKKEDSKVSEPLKVERVKQGSLSALLANGIHLSYSFYGPTGQHIGSPQEAAGGIAASPTPLSSSTHRSKGTEVDSDSSKTQSPMCEGPPSTQFNSLNLSVPNGLLLQFLRETTLGVSSEEQGMLVRQSFPLHGEGEVRQLQDPSLSKELSRIVTSQGAVIRCMRDGSTEVLFADGSVSFSHDCGPVWVPDSEVGLTSQEAEDNNKEQSSQRVAQRGWWATTTPSGARICTVGTTHKHIPTTPLLTFKSTDPITREVMLSREDLVVSVQNPDGSFSVEHADGTRITSLNQDRPPNTPQHILLHAGDQRQSRSLKSTFECACGSTDDVIQDTCGTGEEIKGVNAENAHYQDDAEHACEGLSVCETVCDEQECAESTVYKHLEQSVIAEEDVAEAGKMKDYESEDKGVSTKERVVVVEKEGCATVVMYPERRVAHTFLADGTVITGNNQGAYQVFPSSVGLLQIESDGKCVYSSDPLVTPSPRGGSPSKPPGSYTFSHSDKVTCDITDPDGNHFQVTDDGQVSVLNFSGAPSTLKADEDELEDEDRESSSLQAKHREHCPRLFLVHEDGSGTELLSSQTVEELLYQAYSDPTVAVLKEPLADKQDEFVITILKPSHQSVWSRWLLGKQKPDITPPNLRNRSWHDFPRAETKTAGPQFGTDMGRGLTLRERPSGSAALRQPVRSCPKVLEMRELYQHRPFTTPLRNTVDTRLKEYVESVMEREQRSQETKVKEPRTEEESAHATDLINVVRDSMHSRNTSLTTRGKEKNTGRKYFAEERDAGHTFDERNSVEIASLYSKGCGDEQSDVSEDTAACGSFTKGKESKWADRLAQYRQQMCEEKACRDALRKKNVVPYFHPENIQVYQSLLQLQTPDMKALSMDLPPIKSHGAEALLKDAPQENTPRPLNPTPSKSSSRTARNDRMPAKRPTNPTPHSAGESSLRASSVPRKSIQVDVTGKPRRTKVRLPSSILGSKPRGIPNQQFLSLDEPVRRKCRTTSLTDPGAAVRGFHLLPPAVGFGTQREGTSSAVTVVMRNVGVDTCRFHVKQPPPATGLRVAYKPGPVAAGLQVELQVRLFAMCAAQAAEVEPKTRVSHEIAIHTETDILYLPVTATILPEKLFDTWLKDHGGAPQKKGWRVSRLASGPGGQGVAGGSPP